MDVNNKLGQSRGACWFFAPRGQARRWRCEKKQCFSSALLSVGGWFDPSGILLVCGSICQHFSFRLQRLQIDLIVPALHCCRWKRKKMGGNRINREFGLAPELRCTMFRSGAIYFGLKAVLMHLYCNCHFSSYAPTCQGNLSCVWKSYDFVNMSHVSSVNLICHI